MQRISPMVLRHLLGPLTVLAVTAGCGGLSVYPEKEPPPDEPPPIDLEHCPELCNEAIEAGCSLVECGVDVARDYTFDSDIAVFHLDGASDGGGGCEMVVECPELPPCALVYQDCLQATGDVTACNQQYEFCTVSSVCALELDSCTFTAEETLASCELNTPDADCIGPYLVMLDACQCLYDDCLDTEATLDCVPSEPAPLVSPPIQTAPAAWTVRTPFLDQQLARLQPLLVETRLWPVPTADDSAWRGLRVGAITPGSPLHLLGLRDGDVLRTVNGRKIVPALANPASLLSLRGASLITLVLDRAGVVRTHRYSLTP
jgi:hypothetical protein